MSAGAVVGAIGRLAGGNSRALDETAGAIDKLAKAGKTAVASITGLTSSITGGLVSPLDTVRHLVDTIGNLVGLFNPAIVQQFSLALNDTLAVLGSALVPVMQGMTVYVRAFGDALVGLLPAIQPLFDAIGQYVAKFAQGFTPLLQAAAPFVELFAHAIAFLLEKLSIGVAFLQGVVAELLTMIANLFGLQNHFKAGNSAGFAARQTKVSSVQQFADDVFSSSARNVYSRGGAEKKPEKLLEEIRDAMRGGREVVQKIAANVEAVWSIIKAGFDFLLKLTPQGQQLEREFDRQAELDRQLAEKRAQIKKEW